MLAREPCSTENLKELERQALEERGSESAFLPKRGLVYLVPQGQNKLFCPPRVGRTNSNMLTFKKPLIRLPPHHLSSP
jgi:hypothetical protein